MDTWNQLIRICCMVTGQPTAVARAACSHAHVPRRLGTGASRHSAVTSTIKCSPSTDSSSYAMVGFG